MKLHQAVSIFALFSVVSLGQAATCEPAVQELARKTLEQGRATLLECPASVQTDEGESTAICAVVDGDLETFRAVWKEGIAAGGGIEVLDPDRESERTAAYVVGQTLLTFKDRGGAVVVTCSGSSPAAPSADTVEVETGQDDKVAPSAATGRPSPESSNVADPEKFRKMVGRALAAAACRVFECPESMRRKSSGQGVVCATCDGTFSEFSRDFGGGPFSSAEPRGEWSRSTPHEREYELAGVAVKVRFNGGAVAVTYTYPETWASGEADAE